ncbi:MAG: N-acetyltransferase [Comamonadaceae bacterium]|nr:MAG: N-acetyltransferase [Comamonadaceae bacterium]
MQNFPELETTRLVLREIVLADAPALLAMYQNEASMKWRGSDAPTNLAAVENMIDLFASGRRQHGGTHWGMELKSAPGLIGKCGIYAFDPHTHQCMLAYEMADAHRGAGYMTEALACLLQWMFSYTVINRVGALIPPENTASHRVMERLTFSPEGLQRHAARWSGAYRDMLGYSLLRPEFLEAAPAIASMLSGMARPRMVLHTA